MKAPRHITVGTDLSEESKVALALAAFYAETFDSKVTLANVFDPTPYVLPLAVPAPSDLMATAAREIETSILSSLETLRDEFFPSRKDRVEVVAVRHPSAGAGLAECAEQEGSDLVIVGSHGRTGIRRVLLGSVAEKVVRLANCDVLVARSPKSS